MSASHILGNRNSTPEANLGSMSLRPPATRAIGSSHVFRASADMAPTTPSPLSGRIRPASEVYYNPAQQQQNASGTEDAADKAAQQWIADIDQYETTLEEMAAATLDQDFKDELSAIEQWFKVLSEAERTAALYALLQQTTQVQIRFFIQVLKQMSNGHPMSGVLSPANFENDPMSNRLTDAMNRLSVDGARTSLARPPPSPGAKRNSGLDPSTIQAMFPDAAAAIATQRAKFTQENGKVLESNRNSAAFEKRSSYVAPTIAAPTGKENGGGQAPASPWTTRSPVEQQSIARPRSSAGGGQAPQQQSQQPQQQQQQQQPPQPQQQQHQQQQPTQQTQPSQPQPTPMGQFTQALPPPSAGLRSPRAHPIPSAINVHASHQGLTETQTTELPLLSPYNLGNGNWASMVNTPMVSTFNHQANVGQADMVANAAAMKLAAMSTVSNRIALDDARPFRRGRSTEGRPGVVGPSPLSPAFPAANVVMVNENGQVLSAQQVAALQHQQAAAAAALAGRRSRPASPGMALQGPGAFATGMGFASPQNNGFLTAYDGPSSLLANGMAGYGIGQFGIANASTHEGYLSDASDIGRARSPRGKRATSRPPEDPTDPALLQDIPGWLRSLRLHKYTDNLKDLKWTDLVELDEDALEKRGVNALGARRKMLKVFEQVKEAKSEGKL